MFNASTPKWCAQCFAPFRRSRNDLLCQPCAAAAAKREETPHIVDPDTGATLPLTPAHIRYLEQRYVPPSVLLALKVPVCQTCNSLRNVWYQTLLGADRRTATLWQGVVNVCPECAEQLTPPGKEREHRRLTGTSEI